MPIPLSVWLQELSDMLLDFFVLYLLFVDGFYKGYFLLYSYMSIQSRTAAYFWCILLHCCLVEQVLGGMSPMVPLASHNSLCAVMNGVLPPAFPLISCCEMSDVVKRSVARRCHVKNTYSFLNSINDGNSNRFKSEKTIIVF